MAMVSWVLAWWVRPLCFVTWASRLTLNLNGGSIFLEEIGLVRFCFVGSTWLWVCVYIYIYMIVQKRIDPL